MQEPTISTQLPAIESSTIEAPEVLTKKDRALEKAGATREVAYAVMVKGLTAKRMTVDKFGDEHWEEDTTNQLKASELISRLNGDLKTDVTVDNRVINISGIDGSAVGELLHMVKDVALQLSELRASGRQTGEIIDVVPT